MFTNLRAGPMFGLREMPSRAREINSDTLAGHKVDSSTTGGNVDLYIDVDAPIRTFTDNLGSGLVVGLNVRGANRGDVFTIHRNSGTPGAQTMTVKSGTASGGTSIGVVANSTNGTIKAKFDGTNWVKVEGTV